MDDQDFSRNMWDDWRLLVRQNYQQQDDVVAQRQDFELQQDESEGSTCIIIYHIIQ